MMGFVRYGNLGHRFLEHTDPGTLEEDGMSHEGVLPFGIRFEEPAREAGGALVPTYDDEACVSLLILPSGETVPFVEADLLGTETFTKARSDPTDTDPEDDHARFQGMGTSTMTEVRAESTDTDPEDDHRIV